MKKSAFWLTLIVAASISAVIFITIVSTLLKGDQITFTQDEKKTAPTILKTDPFIGGSSPDVLIVYYGDFACESCAQLSSVLEQMRAEFPDNVTVVWKDFPNTSLHEEAMPAAVAARCAQKQNAFWEYHNMLMANQRDLSSEIYPQIATDIGLWTWRFNMCTNRQKIADLVNASYNEGVELEITTAPTLYINGQRFTGSMRESELRQIIRNLLAS